MVLQSRWCRLRNLRMGWKRFIILGLYTRNHEKSPNLKFPATSQGADLGTVTLQCRVIASSCSTMSFFSMNGLVHSNSSSFFSNRRAGWRALASSHWLSTTKSPAFKHSFTNESSSGTAKPSMSSVTGFPQDRLEIGSPGSTKFFILCLVARLANELSSSLGTLWSTCWTFLRIGYELASRYKHQHSPVWKYPYWKWREINVNKIE